MNPTEQVGTRSEGNLACPKRLGRSSPAEAGFPVTWCWLTLTGTSRTAQGYSQPSTEGHYLQAENILAYDSGTPRALLRKAKPVGSRLNVSSHVRLDVGPALL